MNRFTKGLLWVMIMAVLLFLFATSAVAETPGEFTMDSAVEQLRTAMVNRESTITVHVLSNDEENVSTALFFDALEHDGVPTHGDYLRNHIKNVVYSTKSQMQGQQSLVTITYTITYRTTADQEAAVDAKVQEILDLLDVYDATDYEKIVATYQYICKNVKIDYIGSALGEGNNIHTAYGALVGNLAVCQGYANAFYRLALELGVDCRLLSGKCDGTPHGWNIVKLGDVYYNVDATKDAGREFAQYEYFLKSELPKHIRDSAYTTKDFCVAYPMAQADCLHTEHIWDNAVVLQNPTGYAEGVKEYTCTICQKTKTEAIPREGWELVDGLWCYYVCGKKQTGWQNIGGIQYFFDDQGIMQTAWEKIEGHWYYFAPNGVMKTGWLQDNNHWYYLEESGVMYTGWILYKNNWYYLSETGAMETGWVKYQNNWYYLDADGVMQVGWIKYNHSWYYLNEKGIMHAGWVKYKGKWYYLDDSGRMHTGWIRYKNEWYYLNENGIMETGWIRYKNEWYYLNDSGIMHTGWIKWKDTWYYLHESGIMATGSVKINGVLHKFRDSGVWIG